MKLQNKEVAFFFTHVADMLEVGIPLKDAVASFRAKDPQLIRKITRGLERGLSFAEALKTVSIENYVYSTVTAGESGGALATALRHIAEHIESDMAFSAQVKKTLFMPLLNISVILCVIIFLSTSTLPKLEAALVNLGKIPEFSQTVFHIARVIKENLLTILVVLTAGIASLSYYFSTNPPFLTSVPVMGTIIRYKFIVSLFNRIVLIHSAGGTILDALKIIESTETGIFKKILKSGIKKLQTGKQLEDMCSDPFFPPELKQMVKTASDTGNLGPPFQRIVMIYKRNLKTSSDKLGQVLEPISILIVGILVCVVMIATIYPIISATDSIGGK